MNIHPLRVWRATFSVATCALILASGFSLAAQSLDRSALDAAVAATMAETGIPGLSVALIQNGQVAHVAAFGMSDLEQKVPATVDTKFRTASIAKPITAIALVKLADAQRVDLDQDLSTLVPEWPNKRWPVTSRLVLGHLGGIRHYKGRESNSARAYPSLRAGVAIFSGDPLESEPGTKYRYTTYGFNLLGRVVEIATEKAFYPAIHSLVLEPAGMKDTVEDKVRALIPNRTRYYAKNRAGEIIHDRHIDPSYKVPGGGLLTTAGDLARLGVALLGEDLVSEEVKQQLWTAGKTKDGKATNYGLGFSVRRKAGVLSEFSHTGGQAGTTALFLVQPNRGRGVVILTNLSRVPNIAGIGRAWMKAAWGD